MCLGCPNRLLYKILGSNEVQLGLPLGDPYCCLVIFVWEQRVVGMANICVENICSHIWGNEGLGGACTETANMNIQDKICLTVSCNHPVCCVL